MAQNSQSKAQFVNVTEQITTQMASTFSRLGEICTVYAVRGYAPDGADPITDEDLTAAANLMSIRGDAETFHRVMVYITELIAHIQTTDASAVDEARQDY